MKVEKMNGDKINQEEESGKGEATWRERIEFWRC